MLQWPSSPSVLPKRRSGEESIGHLALLPYESLRPPPIRRWTLGVPKHALSGRTVLEPIETLENSEKVSRSQARTQTLEACPTRSGWSSRVTLPPLDFAGELEDRRIKGCRGASEYLARQDRSGLSAHEKFFVKEAFLRFKSSGADINCSDLFDILSHLGYLGITDETAAMLAKEVSRFSTLDFKELLKVVESAGPWEREHLRTTFERYAASYSVLKDSSDAKEPDCDYKVQLGADGEPSGPCKNGSLDPSRPARPDSQAGRPGPGSSGTSGSFLHAAHLPFLLHAVGMTSEWQAIRETLVQALDLDFPQQPRLERSDRDDAEIEERMLFSFEQVNRILATYRAAQCSSVPLLECAETLFCSVAKTVNRRLEVNIHKVPELLRRLHEYDVSESINEI